MAYCTAIPAITVQQEITLRPLRCFASFALEKQNQPEPGNETGNEPVENGNALPLRL